MTDEFGGPAPRNRMTEDGIELDQWDRYVLPHPVTGAMQGWTRASTVAKTLDDTYNLNLWKQRNVAHGLARRQDLISLVASFDQPHGNNKAAMNDICQRASEAAGGTARRDLGTALHAFTRNHDANTPAFLPEVHRPDIAAYAALLRRYGFIANVSLAERVVCVPEWGIAGRLDRALRCPDGRYRIADVKTGDGADEWGDLEFVIQQGIYRRGLMYGTYDPLTRTWEPFAHPELLDPNVAIIIHLPVGEPHRADAYAIDISAADELVDHALTVRADRKRKNLRVPWSTYAAFLATRQEITTINDPTPQYIPTTVPDPIKGTLLDAADHLSDAEMSAVMPQVGELLGVRIPADDPLAAAARAVTGPLPLDRVPSTYELVRAAQAVSELSALWQVLHPAGHWSVELHEAAIARALDLERAAGQPVSP